MIGITLMTKDFSYLKELKLHFQILRKHKMLDCLWADRNCIETVSYYISKKKEIISHIFMKNGTGKQENLANQCKFKCNNEKCIRI